jgi:hypothetical protein
MMANAVTALASKKNGLQDPAAGRALKLVAMAEIDRNRHLRRIEDCYKYGLPWRHRANQSQPVDQLDEIFDEELMTVLEDFAADMLNTFTPQKSDWVEPKPVETLDAGASNQIKVALASYKRVIFSEMARSNLYQALQEAYVDLGPGTMCMVITDIDPAQPIHCEAVPSVDLLLNRGPYGRVDGIWRKRKRIESDIPELWPEARKDDGQAFDPAGCQEHEVIDGVYRDHTAREAETWCYVVLVDSKMAWKQEYKGRGSNPMIAARWSRDPTTAWGVGPTYRTLPAIKTLNHFRWMSLKNYDKEVDPIVSYEDDGVINVDHGVGPGEWIPRAKDSKPPEPIETGSRIDAQIFQIDEVRAAIRRAHYQDRPEQTGKTPPTATQWADEAAERARRMGTPATNLVIEWQYPIFQRFAYLLEQRGVLPKVELQGKQIALEPISPLLRAQQEEEVVRMDRFAGLLQQRFGPEITAVVLDVSAYAKQLSTKMGIEPAIVRDPAQLQQAIETLAPALGGGGAPAGPPV